MFSWAQPIVSHRAFTGVVIGLILVNAVIVGLETYPALYESYKDWFYYSERIILWVFTMEIVLRILATRPMYRFFGDGWNLFDFVIVAAGHIFAGAQFIVVLRILRVLRVLRAVSVIPSMQRMVIALLRTIPAIGNITLLMGLIFYVFGVIGTVLFAHVSPEYFGTLHQSMLTLFQVVTLESWASGVMRPINAEVPWAWVYFVSFILIGTFIVVNLFIGVIVNNIMEKAEVEPKAEADEPDAVPPTTTREEIIRLREEIAELKLLVQRLQTADKAASDAADR